MRILPQKVRRAIIGVFAMVATTATFTFIAGPFRYASVCDKCGAIRHSSDWQLPGTDVTIITFSKESDSPLSRVLLTNGIVQTHSHHWLFAQGGGHGVKCALGTGRYILFAAESKEFAALVAVLHKQGQMAFSDRVLRVVFDPDTAGLFRNLSFDAPTVEMSASEMRIWIAEQSEYLDEMIPVHKKR
jgi:hypothetical protein